MYEQLHISSSLNEVRQGFISIIDNVEQARYLKPALCFKSKVTWTIAIGKDCIFLRHLNLDWNTKKKRLPPQASSSVYETSLYYTSIIVNIQLTVQL